MQIKNPFLLPENGNRPKGFFGIRPSGHGVIAAAAPGMAADYPLQGQPAPVERTVFDDRFSGILGTGRRKPAAGGGERGN